MKCLDEVVDPSDESPEVEMKVINGASFVNMHPPRSSKLIGEYCDELKQKVEKLAKGVQRLDMVFDVYREKRLKTQTRDARGKGIRVAVRKETLMPKDFHSFIRNCMNKT